ncbi:hypothetical protein B0H66DRAFT_472885 [Apodospora peruviana]|uniref:Uncharacterized protein n=1 Tax=Apodospora peruviana TaxID=516989 RepID=A0AAE0IB28_9PEZI|nr:hypothetical protein B0H66DRAFT_472885 [Apodospora peruviana]
MRLITMPSQRQVFGLVGLAFTSLIVVTSFQHFTGRPGLDDVVFDKLKPPSDPANKKPHVPIYKPKPTYTPPPVKDNFPLLSSVATPPPIPKWNEPRADLHKEYSLPVAPPLLIGFSRTWPILLQAVTSYLTAGWPASQIYVVENTGVQQANARGQLSLQNPFFMNHTQLKMLGVTIVQTPTLLSFAQLQNFYLALSYQHDWPYYFWSHMDVLALSYEDGLDGVTPRFNEAGYMTVYELAVKALKEARTEDPRWGIRFFAYDHLALVNPAAYEDVGGWDTLIPYYITDCDMHSRLKMRGWSMKDAKAGIVTDVSVALADLSALYRIDGAKPEFVDPNPPPPQPADGPMVKRGWFGSSKAGADVDASVRDATAEEQDKKNLDKWRALMRTADGMWHYKHGDRGRNTWQTSQHGGKDEPFYYDAAGLAEAINIMTETGRNVYRHKWGHRDCDLVDGGGLKFEDQWLVEKDWKD